jgi:hypothetical protein
LYLGTGTLVVPQVALPPAAPVVDTGDAGPTPDTDPPSPSFGICPEIPAAYTYQAAISQWTTPNEGGGLPRALQDWPPVWRQTKASVFGQRERLWSAWVQSAEDAQKFEATFGKTGLGVGALLREIRRLDPSIVNRKSKKMKEAEQRGAVGEAV